MSDNERTEKKLVSIGLPTYAGEKRIRAALDSLLAQTYPAIEIIISDNASPDGTRFICEEYAKRDPRIRFFPQKENSGRILNFLFVLNQAQGEFFFWAGDDDYWEPTFVQMLVEGLEQHPDHGVALSTFRRFNEEDNVSEVISFEGTRALTDLSYCSVFKKMVMHEPIHIFLVGLWRRDVLRKFFARPIPKTIAWDRIVMAEAALATHFYSTDEVLFHKYLNPVSIKLRYSKDPEQKRQHLRFAYLRFTVTLLGRVISSPLIPLQRKAYAPIPWMGNLWHRRKRIAGVFLRDMKRMIA